jgi:hypothetical protein
LLAGSFGLRSGRSGQPVAKRHSMANTKRQRTRQQSTASKADGAGPSRQSSCCDSALLTLPSDVLERVLTALDALSLVHMSLVCRIFSAKHRPSGLRVTEKVARDLVVAACGLEQAQRFR